MNCFHLNFTSGILLYSDPKERSEVIQEAHSSCSTSLKELEAYINKHPVPSKPGIHNCHAVHCNKKLEFHPRGKLHSFIMLHIKIPVNRLSK
jgi:hypothetical protein